MLTGILNGDDDKYTVTSHSHHSPRHTVMAKRECEGFESVFLFKIRLASFELRIYQIYYVFCPVCLLEPPSDVYIWYMRQAEFICKHRLPHNQR